MYELAVQKFHQNEKAEHRACRRVKGILKLSLTAYLAIIKVMKGAGSKCCDKGKTLGGEDSPLQGPALGKRATMNKGARQR